MTEILTHAVQNVLAAVVPVRGVSLSKNVIYTIAEDHERVRDLYRQYKLPGTTAEQKEMLAWTIIREVAIHSAKEEQVVYPALRSVLGDLAPDHLLGEHQHLKESLADLSRTPITDPNFDGKLQDIMEILVQHMKEEEEELLPRFAATEGVTEEYLLQLSRAWEAFKIISPSRPHPWAPNKPPLNMVANMTAAPLDFALDLVRFKGAPPL